MNASSTDKVKPASVIDKVCSAVGLGQVENLTLEVNQPAEDRGNRLCVTVSDIHLTDGTVGLQNLGDKTWEDFLNAIKQRCNAYAINEFVLVLDGDVIDMIRSGKWAAHEPPIYPWERERKEEFSSVINAIIRDIVEKQHSGFFKWLRNLESELKKDCPTVQQVKTVITVGNHDKELFCDQNALKYFYERGLGITVDTISEQERKMLGRMYGDENMFMDPGQAPYMPFYYGDTGFRYFTTHGQWRDASNSRKIKKEGSKPGWSAGKWQIETWQQLRFSPFFEPCFGDTVAAGVLSTFIHKTKKRLDDANLHDARLDSVLDELDLYRPTYAAVRRILDETQSMRKQNKNQQMADIIENTLYECVIDWLGWDFTYQSASSLLGTGLKLAKRILEFLNSKSHQVTIKSIAYLMHILAFFESLYQPSVSIREMRKFPSFLPEYRHYGFQIHGEGHTHQPLEEEPNFGIEHPSTYINFGTWRDQIVLRKKDTLLNKMRGKTQEGYRRRGVLRALFILDIVNTKDTKDIMPRTFDYFVTDIVHWSDAKDAMNRAARIEPRV